MTQRQILETYLKCELCLLPDQLRLSSPTLTNYRADSRSFARFQTVTNRKFHASMEYPQELLTLRCDPALSGSLRLQEGFCQAYCAPKEDWISVRLDGSVPTDMLRALLQMAIALANDGTVGLKEDTGFCEWIIPANPKYFDLFKAFNENEIILWKQSSKISAGDIVYMYVAAPYSAILFRCRAVEVDIPYTNKNSRRNITRAMRIQLLHTYDADTFSLAALREHGVTTVRGPRGVPASLSRALLAAMENT